ncbi:MULTISPECIES: hypothetical protein [unclassified Kitasatospora]|uniref:hypothetical protein n=1 Tax=unclassified Kitasatospora TaxID=2633591 RepID=UPI000708EAAD|nr:MULTISPECIES: hypothetical protein [unclassified Kitasatospora]KQV23838.1 hypothetical protein ASC99_01035 [Kitasatospora sp. Root107]KRB67450.1 hypothetical protein ASE03_03700 [Kitasatospora sp. Root187]
MTGREVDPVRELMERHRTSCEQAVDALEIAAALEDAGLGPAEAARCRHADVFSLAEELYARVPRRPPTAPVPVPPVRWQQRSWQALRSAVRHGLPAAALAGGVAVLPPVARGPLAVLCGGWLAWAAARPDGASAPDGTVLHRAGYGAGVALLVVLPVTTGGPAGAVLGVAVATAVGAVEWTTGWLRQVGWGHLGAARTMADFRARMWPALPVASALHLLATAGLGLTGLLLLTAVGPRPGGGLLYEAVHRATGPQWAGQAALALLLLPATVLLRCGRATPAVAGLLAAGTAGLLLTAAARYRPETAQLLACGSAAALLLPYAWLVLGRPGAHRR